VQAGQPQVTFTQLTTTVGCNDGGNFYPSLSANARRIAFISSCDLVPGGNPDQNDEVFVMNANGTHLQQLTFASGGIGSYHASLNSQGTRVAFASDRDLVPGENADLNTEIFTVRADGTGLTQLTHTTGGGADFPGNTYPRFQPLGHQITFTSDRDLVAGGNADGNHEVFVMDADGTGVAQLTHTLGGFGTADASLDLTGDKLLFDSDRDLVPGGNPDENGEIFTMNVDGSDLRQLTNTTGGIGQVAARWTPDGQTLVFRSDLDLAGDNPDGSLEVFRMSIDGTGLVQVTSSSSGFSAPWGISADGKTIAVHSNRSLVPGGNTDLNFEIDLIELK
jgi:Tol biopolymer transport system component